MTACLLWMLLGPISPLGAQNDFEAVIIPVSDQADLLLSRAREKIRSEDYDAAVLILQDLIQQYGDRVHQVEEATFCGVREECLRLISRLPEEGLSVYRKRFDPFLLDIEKDPSSSVEAIADAVHRYPLATQAPRLGERLADIALEKGDFSRSLFHLDQALRWLPAENLAAARMLGKKAFVLAGMKDVQGLGDLLDQVHELHRKARIEVAGKPVDLTLHVARFLAQVRSRRGKQGEVDFWPIWGGNVRHDLAATQAIPLVPQSWFARIPTENRLGEKRVSGRLAQKEYRYSPYHVVVAGGEVFLSNGVGLYAFDLYSGESRQLFEGLVDDIETQQRPHVIYGLTYDRGFLYANLEGPNDQPEEKWHWYDIQVPIPERKLLKIDARSGKVAWILGDPSRDPEAFLNKVWISSPPIVLGETLFVIGNYFEGMLKCYLLAIDVHSGSLRWRRRLCSGQQELNMFGRPVKELPGTILASDRGVLYAVTGLGAIVAIEAATGDLLWLTRYDRLPVMATTTSQVRERPPAWANCPPILVEDRLLVAPLDSNRFYCLSATTGKTLWSRFRSGSKYLVWAGRKQVILAGQDLSSLTLGQGSSLWEKGFAGGEKVYGQGAVAGNSVYIPTDRALYRFDLTTGRLLARQSLRSVRGNEESPGGNLLVVDGALISVSRKQITVYFDMKKTLQLLQASIQKHPDDPNLHLRLGGMYLKRKQYEEALGCFIQAHRLSTAEDAMPDGDIRAKARDSLFSIYLLLARGSVSERPEEGKRWYQSARKYATTPEQKIRLLLGEAELFEKLASTEELFRVQNVLIQTFGDHRLLLEGRRISVGLETLLQRARYEEARLEWAQAVHAYQSILHRFPEEQTSGVRQASRPGREVAYLEISRLIEEHGRIIYSSQERLARRLFAEAKQGGSGRELRRLLALYPNSEVIPECTLELARILVVEDRRVEAAAIWRNYLRSAKQPEKEAEVYCRLARNYEKLEWWESARKTWLSLGDLHGERTVVVEGVRTQVKPLVEKSLKRDEYLGSDSDVELSRHLTLRPRQGESSRWKATDNAPQGVQVLDLPFNGPDEVLDKVYLDMAGELECRVARTGKVVWKVRVGTRIRQAVWARNRLVVRTAYQVQCFNPQTGHRFWTLPFQGSIRGFCSDDGLIAVIASRAGRQRKEDLHLVDGASGVVVWSESIPGLPSPTPIFSDTEIVVSLRGAPGKHLFFNLVTGATRSPLLIPSHYLFVPPALSSSKRLIVTGSPESIWCYDIRGDRVLWKSSTRRLSGMPISVAGNQVVVQEARGGRIRRFDLDSGKAKDSIDVPPADPRSLVVSGKDLFYITREDGEKMMVAYDLEKDEIRWKSEFSEDSSMGSSVVRIFPLKNKVVVIVDQLMPENEHFFTRIFVIQKNTGKRYDYIKIKNRVRHRTSSVTFRDGVMILGRGKDVHAYGGK
jgi:outer membrane protein assembly factor BamB